MGLVDFLFPRTCIGCGYSGVYLCQDCLLHAPKHWLICPYCKKASPLGKTHDGCKSREGLDGLISIYKCRGVVKKTISKLKYSFAYDIATPLAQVCSDNLKNIIHLQNIVLVPIPLHRKRQNWRGFNQTEELAKILAKKLKWELNTKLLIRVRHTRPQIGLKNIERVRNICGEFAVNAEAFEHEDQGKTIVLFDDIWTSGSTISEACKELKKNGFKDVWGLTIAR